MGEKHIARLEPVGIELEVDEDETILDAAFRQGIMLMHGCKEGQCASCKSFLLDGEVDLDRYSTFALPDFEEAGGLHAAVPRARALRRRDRAPALRRGGAAQRRADRRGDRPRSRPSRSSRTTSAGSSCELRDPEALEFNAGQYVDIAIPGADGEHRSFSMANTPGEPDRLEFMIKLYEGGHFSGLLANGDGIKVGDELTCTGPYGDLHAARQLAAAARLHRRRGRDGAGPVAAALDGREGHGAPGDLLLRRAHRGRPVRARRARAAVRRAARPARSSPRSPRRGVGRRDRAGHRRRRPHGGATSPRSTPTSAARRRWSTRRSPCSSARGCPESHIYFDRFTTTAD